MMMPELSGMDLHRELARLDAAQAARMVFHDRRRVHRRAMETTAALRAVGERWS